VAMSGTFATGMLTSGLACVNELYGNSIRWQYLSSRGTDFRGDQETTFFTMAANVTSEFFRNCHHKETIPFGH